MTLVVREIIGTADEPRFALRNVERLVVDAAEAGRPRLRRQTDHGTDVAIDLPRGSYLRDGAVLDDDGTRIVVVDRKREEVAVVRLPQALSRDELTAAAVRVGHVAGNQHVPLEVEAGEIRIPVTTSRDVLLAILEAAGIDARNVGFEQVPLGRHGPLTPATHGASA